MGNATRELTTEETEDAEEDEDERLDEWVDEWVDKSSVDDVVLGVVWVVEVVAS